jgi:hypothetical protein
MPNSTLAAPSKSDHRQCGDAQEHFFVQQHVSPALPIIPKDSTGAIMERPVSVSCAEEVIQNA